MKAVRNKRPQVRFGNGRKLTAARRLRQEDHHDFEATLGYL